MFLSHWIRLLVLDAAAQIFLPPGMFSSSFSTGLSIIISSDVGDHFDRNQTDSRLKIKDLIKLGYLSGTV